MLLELANKPKRQMISLTPLIDVVFILLLFFMLSSSFIKWQQITLTSPAEAQTTSTLPVVRVLNLESNQGKIRFDTRELNMFDQRQLTDFIDEDKTASYVLTVSEGVNVQAMVTLLDNLKHAGANHVSLSGVLP